MVTRIEPSPAIQVNSDTPISECVSLMNERGIGSVLVNFREDPNGLVGIFTERDLLRNIELIHTGGYWSFPVSSIMSRPVVTVERQYLDQAATLMLQYGFRHLPVMETLPGGQKKLAGIVSIRDILRAKVIHPEPHAPTDPNEFKPLIHVQTRSPDPKFVSSITQLLKKLLKNSTFVTQIDPATEKPSQGLFVVDADGMESTEIARVVRIHLARAETRAIFIIHSPGSISDAALKAYDKLRSTGKLELFPKPLNLLSLSDAIGRMRIGLS